MKALTFQTIKCLFVGGVAIVTYVKESKDRQLLREKSFKKDKQRQNKGN